MSSDWVLRCSHSVTVTVNSIHLGGVIAWNMSIVRNQLENYSQFTDCLADSWELTFDDCMDEMTFTDHTDVKIVFVFFFLYETEKYYRSNIPSFLSPLFPFILSPLSKLGCLGYSNLIWNDSRETERERQVTVNIQNSVMKHNHYSEKPAVLCFLIGMWCWWKIELK